MNRFTLLVFAIALLTTILHHANANEDMKNHVKEEYGKVREECIKEVKIDEEHVSKMEKGEQVDHDMDCYVGCAFQKMGWITSEGKPNEEFIDKVEQMPEGNLKIGIQFVCGRIREALKHSTTRCDAGKHLQELVDHFRHVKI